jgi:hypothetical protein
MILSLPLGRCPRFFWTIVKGLFRFAFQERLLFLVYLAYLEGWESCQKYSEGWIEGLRVAFGWNDGVFGWVSGGESRSDSGGGQAAL